VLSDALLPLLLLKLPVERRPLPVRALIDPEGVAEAFVLLLLPSGLDVGIGVFPPVPLASVISPLIEAPANTAPASIATASGSSTLIRTTSISSCCSCISTVGGTRLLSTLLRTCVGRHVTGGSGGGLLPASAGTDTVHTSISTSTGIYICSCDHLGRVGPSPFGGLLALPALLLPSVGLPLALSGDALLDLLLAEPSLVFEPLP
jgi:hypothetical protein